MAWKIKAEKCQPIFLINLVCHQNLHLYSLKQSHSERANLYVLLHLSRIQAIYSSYTINKCIQMYYNV